MQNLLKYSLLDKYLGFMRPPQSQRGFAAIIILLVRQMVCLQEFVVKMIKMTAVMHVCVLDRISKKCTGM